MFWWIQKSEHSCFYVNIDNYVFKTFREAIENTPRIQHFHWFKCSCFEQTWNRKNATVPKLRKFCILKYGKSDLFCGNQILFLASQARSDLFQLAATWTEYEIHISRANGRGGKYYKYFCSLCKLLPGEFWQVLCSMGRICNLYFLVQWESWRKPQLFNLPRMKFLNALM